MRPASIVSANRAPRKRRLKTSTGAEANQPQLTYSILPDAVQVGSRQTFSFTMRNMGESAVTVQAVTDSVTLGNLGQLTNTTVSPQTPPSPWQATPTGQTIQYWALSDVILGSGDSVTFTFIAEVLKTPGTASLTVIETIGGNTAQAPPLPVLIQNALTIAASANPASVGQQRAVQLQWDTIGGEYVTISPGDGQQYPAGTSSTMVAPNQSVPQTIYTLTVHQGTQSSQCNVTVNLCAPVIDSLQMTPSDALEIDQSIQAAWATAYGTEITMSPSLGESPFVQAVGSQSFVPSKALPANAMSEPYTITVYGFQGPIQRTLTLNFAPMRIRYLRFSTFPTEQRPTPPVIYDVFNAQPGTSLNATGVPILLTAVGPGGPHTAELNGSGPEVQVMLADPASVPQGQSTVISFLVKNATSLRLQPGDVPLTFDADGKGSTTVTPAQTTTYILAASDGGVTVTSELDVPVA